MSAPNPESGTSPSVRVASHIDLDGITEIYVHYVATSVATFELDAPDRAVWLRRFDEITDAGLPFLVAELDAALAAYAYCAPWKTRPAYRATVEDSGYVAPWPGGRRCGTSGESPASGTNTAGGSTRCCCSTP
jgi:L-amino acid N-acyltransferase YncA